MWTRFSERAPFLAWLSAMLTVVVTCSGAFLLEEALGGGLLAGLIAVVLLAVVWVAIFELVSDG